MKILWATVLLSQFFANGTAVTAQTDLEISKIDDIVRKAVPPIIDGAAEWMADNDCVSCHRVTYAAWALNLAADQQLNLAGDKDTAKRHQQINRWSTDWTKVANPKVRAEAVQHQTLRNDSDTVVQALLGVAAVQNQFDKPWAEAYLSALIAGQQPAGFWKPAGQLPLQKRRLRETREVSTMWAMVALNDSQQHHPKMDSAKGKASLWLNSNDKIAMGESTEWWALKVVLSEFKDAARAENLATARLLSFQNSDGGWGWLVDEQSDALGTGIALYALARQTSTPVTESRVRAVEFLRATQLEDGSWDVHGTKKSGRDNVVETASYWGTCWAVIGMLQ